MGKVPRPGAAACFRLPAYQAAPPCRPRSLRRVGREERMLAAAGQAGVERALEIMRTDIERDMRLVGAKKISELSVDNLRFR